jgi:hypothetical protein
MPPYSVLPGLRGVLDSRWSIQRAEVYLLLDTRGGGGQRSDEKDIHFKKIQGAT